MGSVGVLNSSALMVCAPLMSESVEQIVSEMYSAKTQGADLVEIRLDQLKDFQPLKHLHFILQNKPLPLLFVYRPKCEGGLYEADDSTRFETLCLAHQLGADYVEFDLKMASDRFKEMKTRQTGSKIIVSCYLNGPTPSIHHLTHLAATMQATGAHIIKLVSTAQNITEINTLFSLLSNCKVPIIAYSIGERGLISQILSPKYGGFLVYGSIEGSSIPGVPTIHSLREAYKVECINSDINVFGLISKPVGHSKGPLLHNPTFRHMNYNGIYVPMFVDDLKDFFSVYTSPDFAGYSVGFPYKEAVIEFCDEVTPLAKSIGAVNTIVWRSSDGKLIGYNTDCEASITAIEDALKEHGYNNSGESFSSPLSGRQFVLAGAGGAGRALAFGAKSRGSRIIIFDIDFERAKGLADAVLGEAQPFENLDSFKPKKGAVFANATPLGMHPNTDTTPLSEGSLRNYQLVFDAVYTPRKTRLLKEAETAGAITVSGVEMFLRQAIGQFNLFTGKQAPTEFMRDIVLAKF
ncbi:Shikimate dehydrogenase (NADP(+)) [Euphorbia peplus]|nr:Shikimate dehydrogenase (NADP(+)) [Euphorbia peplus]